MKALACFLVALIFLSKLSLSWTGIVPSSYSYLIFQSGLHPYLNLLLNFSVGGVLSLMWLKSEKSLKLHPLYRALLIALALILSTQTLVQIFFVHFEQPALFQLIGLSSALFLVLVFGVIIPSVAGPDRLFRWIWWGCTLCVIPSVLFVFVFQEDFYKGGRFIGLLKHIPYMVSVATIGFIFTLSRLMEVRQSHFKVLGLIGVLLICFYAILLTGTRSSAFAALLALIVFLAMIPSPNTHRRFLKLSALGLALSALLLFGPKLFDMGYSVMRGEQAMMGRAAQDGVASRVEEVERGLKIFEQHPMAGLGLMFKYMGQEGIEVDSYNSFKDPHNIIVSAGVIGGWPLMIFVSLSFLGLSLLSLVRLFHSSLRVQIFALYVLVHLPILFIYHLHFSPGGLADRIYWLSFGVLALRSPKK